jgi:hypothetical protein
MVKLIVGDFSLTGGVLVASGLMAHLTFLEAAK